MRLFGTLAGRIRDKANKLTEFCVQKVNPPWNQTVSANSDSGNIYDAKYIGSLKVAKPKTKCEIVCAMRTVRNEFKLKKSKKHKVKLKVSLQGIEILLNSMKSPQCSCKHELILMHHPIYRIFFVSHDSQNREIFSYIAKESSSDVFKCNVFKASGTDQASSIVQAIGQAFDVCHSLCRYSRPAALQHYIPGSMESANCSTRTSGFFEMDDYANKPDATSSENRLKALQTQLAGLAELQDNQEHEFEVIRSRLKTLEQKLTMESSARTYLQAYNQNLSEQNRELTIHLQSLVGKLKLNDEVQNALNSSSQTVPSSIYSSSSIDDYGGDVADDLEHRTCCSKRPMNEAGTKKSAKRPYRMVQL